MKLIFEIRKEVFNYFSEMSKESNFDRPRLDGVVFRSLAVKDNLSLIKSFFPLHELDSVDTLCDGNKSSGPDGFSFSFIRRFWSLFRDEFEIIFDQFHRFSLLPRSFASYRVSFISKVKSPI